MTIHPVHLLGVSGNVTWITSQGPSGEHVHKFEMFIILKYGVRMTKIFLPYCQATDVATESSLYPNSCG